MTNPEAIVFLLLLISSILTNALVWLSLLTMLNPKRPTVVNIQSLIGSLTINSTGKNIKETKQAVEDVLLNAIKNSSICRSERVKPEAKGQAESSARIPDIVKHLKKHGVELVFGSNNWPIAYNSISIPDEHRVYMREYISQLKMNGLFLKITREDWEGKGTQITKSEAIKTLKEYNVFLLFTPFFRGPLCMVYDNVPGDKMVSARKFVKDITESGIIHTITRKDWEKSYSDKPNEIKLFDSIKADRNGSHSKMSVLTLYEKIKDGAFKLQVETIRSCEGKYRMPCYQVGPERVVVDIDNLTDLEIEGLHVSLSMDNYIEAFYKSCGGKGLHIVMKVKEGTPSTEICLYFKTNYRVNVDLKRGGVTFVSYDPNIYINPSSEIFG